MNEQGETGTGEVESLRRQVAGLEVRLEESHRDRDEARHLLAEEARHREQLETELRLLDRLADPRQTQVTAKLFSNQQLKGRMPKLFQELADRYADLLDQALEQQSFQVEHRVSEALRNFADQLGHLLCGPRDVVDLHQVALRARMADLSRGKANALGAEGRFVILELMGSLASYYRNRSLAWQGQAAPAGAVSPPSAPSEEKHG